MKNIALKLKLFNYSENAYPTLGKFLSVLTDEVVSYEELNAIFDFLASKGIIISKPSQNKIFANNISFIKSQVDRMDEIGELDAYREDPLRINSKGAIERLLYMKNNGEVYRNEQGKYSRVPFVKSLFESKYGKINFEHDNQELKEDVVSEEAQIPQNTDNIVLEPVASIKENKDIAEDSHEDLNETVIVPPVVEEVILAPESEVGFAVEDVHKDISDIVLVEELDPLDELLLKPQTISFTDDTFDRYEELSENIRHILMTLYGAEEINDAITDNLIKLVTNDVPGDEVVILKAITYGKNISEAELQRLKNVIREEVEYSRIANEGHGRAA